MIIFISIFFLFFILICMSKLKINIINFDVQNTNLKLKINLGLYILKFIKIFSISFTENEIQLLFIKIPYNKLKTKNLDKNILKNIKTLNKFRNLKIDEFDLNLQLGLKNVFFVTFIVPVLSTILSFIKAKNIKKLVESDNFKYNIKSKFGSNFLNVNFKAKFSTSVYSFVYFLTFSK